ncbi:MAG TPA: FixH family protein [Polyangiaceae bacterium]
MLSESGALSIAWKCVSQDAPARGLNRFELSIASTESEAPVDGLALSMVPFMPAMGHGSSTVPEITALGGGKYEADDVVLSMPGVWELRIAITGEEPDYAVPRVEID